MSPAEYDARRRAFKRECMFLSETSGWRSIERNEAVGGKPGSKHVYGMGNDYSAPTQVLLERAKKIAVEKYGFWVEVHNVGSGMHLHIQGLAPGDPPKEWIDLYGEETGWTLVASTSMS